MSTTAEPVNPDEMKAAIANVRADAAGVNRHAWVIIQHVDNNPNAIDVLAQGEDINELQSHLQEDQVLYLLLRFTTAFDMSNTVKFVYVRWVGEEVPPTKKGRYGVVHGSVQEHFTPFHLQLEISAKEELTEDAIKEKLDDSSGTRNKVIDHPVKGMQQRGFTQHSVAKQNTGVAKSVAPAGADVEVDTEVQSAIGEVRDDSKPTSWILATFEDGQPKKPLILVATGTGDIDELKESLQDDQVMYGLYRTADKIDDIATVKFVYIYWIGENVKPLTKGKVSACAGPIEKIFSPAHVTLSFNNRYDITAEVINDKVTASSGSKSFVK